MPACPSLPLYGDNYIAEYYGVGSAPHYFYLYGLFGMRDRLKNSDVLLLGSSHVEVGLSAAELEKNLSNVNKRKVRAYNLGLGFAEGIGFDNDIIAANNLRNKTLIVDLFMPGGESLSNYGDQARQSNTFAAYLRVFQLWTTCIGDRLLDPVLPRFYPDDFGNANIPGLPVRKRIMGFIAPRRYLMILGIRSWSTGDDVLSWSPDEGVVSNNPPPDKNILYGHGEPAYQYMKNIGIFFPAEEQEMFHRRNLNVIYTLLPFEGYKNGSVPPEAEPYISIIPDGLTYYEGMHLNSPGRVLATERLFNNMHSQGLDLQITSVK